MHKERNSVSRVGDGGNWERGKWEVSLPRISNSKEELWILVLALADWSAILGRMDCWISLHPRESQKASPTPQFKSINYLEASLHRYN